ncbi:MAG TPA: hypothetical protein VE863_08160 [Pyrinomonadaceae bacterium]|jgi:hypothetical protein|nr:hypothetical protein [Pyrinomonadaceae bacterium]
MLLSSFHAKSFCATLTLGIIVLTTPASLAQAQRPEIKITQTDPVRNVTPESRFNPKLTLAQKQQAFRALIETLSLESARHPELKLNQFFPLAKTNYDLNFVVLPTILSPAAPRSTTAYLSFLGPDRVGPNASNKYCAGFSGTVDSHLIVALNLSPGTYLLDFSVDALGTSDPMKVSIDPFGNSPVTMQTNISQGHLLVPILISKAEWHFMLVSRSSAWTFFLVELNKA